MDSSLGIKVVEHQIHSQPQAQHLHTQHQQLPQHHNNRQNHVPYIQQQQNQATNHHPIQTAPKHHESSILAISKEKPSSSVTTSTTTATEIIDTKAPTATTTTIVREKITSQEIIDFFEKGLHDSYEATDKLIKKVEQSQDVSLSNQLLQIYQHHYNNLDRPWEHVTLLYGLGLIYMHFNAYKWAVKSFRHALYVQPSFPRSNEVHARLGLIFKAIGRYKLSEKHFNLAINGSKEKHELKFQIAHLNEIQGKYKEAIDKYEQLLQEKNLPQRLSANINRQLGWINYNSSDSKRVDAALNYLNTSYKCEADSETSYFLGRCLTNVGKFQDAFASYRSVIDKEESTADTWCSIGVLYQHQNQPWDALQAYIRAVQYDKKHAIAWMNLGVLYESHKQFADALKCYQHVVRLSLNEVNKSLSARVEYLHRHLKETALTTKSADETDKLLSLEDLWNLECKNSKDNNNLPIMGIDNPSNHITHPAEQTIESKEFCASQAITNGGSIDSGISSDSSSYTDCALVPSQTHPSAEQVVESCRDNSRLPLKLDINLLNDDNEPPSLFCQSPPYPPLSPDKMFPSPPSIFLESKKELTMKRLQDLSQSHPISIVRNIATVLKLDLGLFSTKTLVDSNPDQQIEVISHLLSPAVRLDNQDEFNVDWTCERHRSNSTISRYATYQVNTFRESLQAEKDNRVRPNLSKESETDSNESSATATGKRSAISLTGSSDQNLNRPPPKRVKSTKDSNRYVKSADFIDLSDETHWRSQLNELNKLPHFIKCVSASNMLTHIGAPLPGVNTISMSMHVPGCRVAELRAPNNFCLVTINTGPGDYEWCSISGHYEETLSKLCTKHGLDLESRNWWPKLRELQNYNVPIYRFSQRSGDLVLVNPGTFCWIQSTGWANSIQWNIGPLNAKQYRLSSQSFEVNKLVLRKSDVPMIQLTWNIVINVNWITDDDLFNSMTDVLRRSLKHCIVVRDFIMQANEGKKIKIVDGNPGPRLAKYCNLCETEIFNISFKRKNDGFIHCVECARRSDPSLNEYKIYQEYDLKYLMRLYDSFIKVKQKFQARQLQAKLVQQQHHHLAVQQQSQSPKNPN